MYGQDIQFNRDTKLVDFDGLKKFPKPLSKLFVLIKTETLLKSWKPFYFLRESLSHPGLVLVVVIYYELLLTVFSKLSELN